MTFQETEQFFNVAVTVEPAGCTETVVYTSGDELVATVNQQGKIMAVGGGTTEITATCGAYSAVCLVTCDFAAANSDPAAESTAPGLSSEDMTFTYPNQQATLLVTNVPDEAELLFSSADTSVATVSSSGVITAVRRHTTKSPVQVLGQSLDASSAAISAARPKITTARAARSSPTDVTMSIKGEYSG